MSGGDRCWPPLTGLLFWFDLGRESRLPLYGTPVMATSFIPFDDPEEVAGHERADGARKALAVLLAAAPDSYSPGSPCPSCVLAAPRLPPLGFPLAPLA